MAATVLSAALSAPLSAQTQLTTERVVAGLDNPVDIQHAPGDERRLFIVEQSGYIQLIKDGALLPDPFLKIPSRVQSGGEQGLLGLAFHPDYQQNLYFYVNYTDLNGDTVIERFERRINNEDKGWRNSGTIILGPIQQPYSNHNGGGLAFSPNDGYLYIAMGDGGSANDPGCRAQDGSTLLGKMLRIDVDGGFPYIIPPDNPFVGDSNILDEIWHFGLRNPWRWSFDRANGDLYYGDVGQNAREEISWQSGASAGGENYGWKVMEAHRCNSKSNCDSSVKDCNDPAYTDPIHDHSTQNDGCSITGGRVYRGCAIPDLQGTYFFGDYCSSRVWSFRYDGSNLSEFQERTSELDPGRGNQWNAFTCFGEDLDGELYVGSHNGDVFKIVAAKKSWQDLGYAKTGANGLEPEFSVCGRFDSGNQATFSLDDAPANQFGLLFISTEFNPFDTWGGTVVALPPIFLFPSVMDANGHWDVTVNGGLGDFSFYMQWVLTDPGNTADTGISNAIQVFFEG